MGGVYTFLDGPANHIITFQSCDFIENWSGSHAGGMEIEFWENENELSAKRVEVQDCVFHGNHVVYGGVYVLGKAACVFLMMSLLCNVAEGEGGNAVVFERCSFERNQATEVGAALGVASHRFFDNRGETMPLIVTDWLAAQIHTEEREGGREGGRKG